MEKRKGFLNMVTFSKEEILPAKDLRTLSQKSLLELLSKHEKLGVIVKDELAFAMLKVETLEAMVARIHALEEMVEDMEDASQFGVRTSLPETEWETKLEGMSLLDWYLQRRKADE